MEEKIKQQLQLTSSTSSSLEEEEFYENIQAPKFVDFASPNHFNPDDRFWFCSRVGCDQTHEEEMDSEAIYKKFVLRVMAARSPNIRFRKALYRRPPIENKKCPATAPPKPSKCRVSRLAVASSISKKLFANEKVDNKPSPAKPSSTPKVRVKHVAAKYMTSPRKKKGASPNPSAFRSVRNPKRSSITAAKKVTAKALVFNSTMKARKRKQTEELVTPITKLCQGIKKLEINTQKKGFTQKPTTECTNVRKVLPLASARKQPSVRRANVRSGDPSCSHSATKSSRCVKTKTKTDKKKQVDTSVDDEKAGCEPRPMEVEVSSAGNLKFEENIKETVRVDGSATPGEETTTSAERSVIETTSDEGQASSPKGEKKLLPETENQVSEQETAAKYETLEADNQSRGKNTNNTNSKLENRIPEVIDVTEIDDKENASNSQNISNSNVTEQSKHDAPLKHKIKTVDRTLKENCAAGTQAVKYKKLKPTQPRPFRLRTDERCILKEATGDRKANSHDNASIASENPQCTENGELEKRGKENNGGRNIKKNLARPIKSKYRSILKESELKSDRDLRPTSEDSTRTKFPFLQKRFARPQRETVTCEQAKGLAVIEETSSMISKPIEVRKQIKVVNPANKAQNTVARITKPVTIPRGPNFHHLHKTRGCTKTVS